MKTVEPILTVNILINAGIQKVWNTLIDPSLWWSGVTLTIKVGGAFQEVWQENGEEKISVGKVLSLNPPSRLEIQWQESDWPKHMKFSFNLNIVDFAKTEVELIEEGWEMFSSNQRKKIISSHKKGWKFHLEDLKKAAEVSLNMNFE